jgi:hypothetical protein
LYGVLTGNLVRSYTECLSTDACPPPEPNIVVHCTRIQQPKPFRVPQINGEEREAIDISTDKQTYRSGETVNITIKNNGRDPLTFPNSILGLKIENSQTHEKFPLFAAQVITVLDSGGARSLKWDQADSSGQQVKAGNFTASTSTGHLTANTTFSIVK